MSKETRASRSYKTNKKKLDTTSSLALLLGRCDGMDAKGIGKFKIFISHVRGRGHLYRQSLPTKGMEGTSSLDLEQGILGYLDVERGGLGHRWRGTREWGAHRGQENTRGMVNARTRWSPAWGGVSLPSEPLHVQT